MSGRIRSVKPEWLEDEKIASASDEARLLSIALLLMADDHGRGRASVASIAAGAWRYEFERDDGANARETLAKASRAFRELLDLGFVRAYEVNGQRYFEIVNWARHQKVDKVGKPRVPPPNHAESHDSRDSRETLATTSRDCRETLAPDLRSPISDQGSPITDPDQSAAGPTNAFLASFDHSAAPYIEAFRDGWADATGKRIPVSGKSRLAHASRLRESLAGSGTDEECLGIVRSAAALAAQDPECRSAQSPFPYFVGKIGAYAARLSIPSKAPDAVTGGNGGPGAKKSILEALRARHDEALLAAEKCALRGDADGKARHTAEAARLRAEWKRERSAQDQAVAS